MPKTERKEVVHCEDHQFTFRPLKQGLYYKQTISVSFCKGKVVTKTRGKKKEAKKKCYCYPIFNKDKSHATSAFILPQEQENFMENKEKFKQEHDGKVQDLNEEKSELFFPKPKTKYMYCSVCKKHYEDYRDHVLSINHKTNIRRSYYTRLIQQHERKYEDINVARKIKNKNGDATETSLSLHLQREIQEDLGNPYKRVKRDLEPTIEPAERIYQPTQLNYSPYPFPITYPTYHSPFMPFDPRFQHFPYFPTASIPQIPPPFPTYEQIEYQNSLLFMQMLRNRSQQIQPNCPSVINFPNEEQ